jgi:hypothetical protein
MKRIGRIRIKTLLKALLVCYGALVQNRILTIHEIIQTIGGSKSNAYNYQRFLRRLYPTGAFDEDRPVEDEQRCLM